MVRLHQGDAGPYKSHSALAMMLAWNERLARALEVTVPDLLSGGERTRQEEVRDLMQDPFVSEMMPFLSQLNGLQMSSILAQVRDLTVRPRRSA